MKTIRVDGSLRTVPSASDGEGMRWRARYVGPDGREHSKRFARKADAQAWLDKTTTEVGTHTWVHPSRSRELFGALAEAWFVTKASKKPKTVTGYRSILDVLVLPRCSATPLVAGIPPVSRRLLVPQP